MNWRLKGIVQKAVSVLPGRDRINRVLQTRFGGLREPEREMDSKVLDDWLVFADHLKTLGLSTANRTFVEVGSGWYPTLPTCFALAGAARVDTFDLTVHLDEQLTRRLIERLGLHLDRIASAGGLPLDDVRARHRELAAADSTTEILRRARIRYNAPADASRTGLPDASVDVVYSNSVLEHVTPEALRAIMKETARILRPDGYAIHSVNCGDHYAHSDPAITQVNYLRFSERQWSFWNNELQYQNRLRARDFLEASEAAGLVTVFSKARPRPELVAEVSRMRLPDRFRGYSFEDLAITSVDFAARPA
jgi:SAM-dependent methyltransferase